MHTLPAPVIPLCALNGRTNVTAFYSTRGQIVLYRLNGELVWASPARKQKQPKHLCWSPDGLHLAVIYQDGMMQIFSEHTGRTTQIVANENISSICWQTEPPRRVDEVPHDFQWFENLIHAIGSRDSSLKVTLDGVLPVGALDLDAAAIEQISFDSQVYSVITESHVYCIHAEYLTKYSPRQVDDLVVKAARVQKLCDTLKAAAAKYKAEMVQFSKSLAAFLSLDDPVPSIYSMLISRVPNEGCARWIDDMHEVGFKKWVKATEQYYSTLQTLLSSKLLASAQHLVIYLSDIFIDDSQSDETGMSMNKLLLKCRDLAKTIYNALMLLAQQLTKEQHACTAFACTLQVIYCQHLDRSINVIDKKVVAETNSIDALGYVENTLADPQQLQVPAAEINDFEAQVSRLMGVIKQELKQQLQPRASHHWPGYQLVGMSREDAASRGRYDLIAKTQDQAYHYIKWSSKTGEFTIKELGLLTQAFFQNERLITLESHQLAIFTRDLQLVETHDLNYEGISCSVSGDTAVVVSKDCLHFDTIKLAV